MTLIGNSRGARPEALLAALPASLCRGRRYAEAGPGLLPGFAQENPAPEQIVGRVGQAPQFLQDLEQPLIRLPLRSDAWGFSRSRWMSTRFSPPSSRSSVAI
jgi:hypothetical protein